MCPRKKLTSEEKKIVWIYEKYYFLLTSSAYRGDYSPFTNSISDIQCVNKLRIPENVSLNKLIYFC